MRRPLTRIVALLLAVAAMGGMIVAHAHAKTERTWYDDERLAIMRENLETYDWARDYVTRLLEGSGEEQPWHWGGHRFSVRRWAERDDQFFWELMPSTRVTMAYDLDKYGVSPRHGTAVREGRAFYHPWNYDPWGHPYKIQDPIDGTWYPSNDFGAGDMTSGPYPDDGTGMVIDGERYFPIREYAITTYLYCVVPLLDRMSRAYLLTGDARYAHKAAVLLAKVAHEYPNPTDRADRCQRGPWGPRSGLVTDHIWETFKLTSMALTYDAIYDAIGEDEELVAFLRERGVAVESPRDVREFIEESIFRIGMLALEQGVIRGNEGFHQETAMALALVMDDHDPDRHPNSRDMVEWCMYGPGQMACIMPNGLFRDGGGFESPSYNTIKFDFVSAATYFEQLRRLHPDIYPEDAYPDIFAHPKARAMFDWFIDLTVQNRFLPSIGDTGGSLLAPRKVSDFWAYAYQSDRFRFAYHQYHDPRYARVFIGEEDRLPHGDPFEEYDGAELLAAAQRPEARIEKHTRLLDGYGVAFLTSGEGDATRTLTLNYSNHFHHRQFDRLNINLYHRYIAHLPDMGYPYTWEYPEWDTGTYTHNVVTVDELNGQRYCPMGRLNLVAEAGPLHAVSAAHDPYMYDPVHNPDVPAVDLYERTCVLVDVSPTEFYVVDLFAVSGGEQHDQSWHGPMCPIERPELDWRDRPGTVAGPDIDQFASWTDRWGREHGGPLSFLTGVSRASAEEPVCFTWLLGLEEDARLRLNIVPVDGPVELILSSGRSPARPPDWSLDYLFVRRTGDPGLRSRFVTVIDTHAGEPGTVRSVRVLERVPLTLGIEHSAGLDLLTLRVPMSADGPFAPRKIGVTLRRDGETWSIGSGDNEAGYEQGTVIACDYEANAVTVEGITAEGLEGRFVRLFTDARSSTYRILAAEPTDDGVRLQLDRTNLLFEALIDGVEDGRLSNAAAMLHWFEREDDDGHLIPWGIWNRDAALVSEDGQAVRRIYAVPNGRTIYLQDVPTAAELRAAFTDANGDGRILARAYDYAVGSRVEIARIAHSR